MKTLVTIDPRLHDAVIFDLDGVVTDTASIHAAAWAAMFDDFLQRRPANACENHTPFTDDDYRHFVDGKPRYDGVVGFPCFARNFASPRRPVRRRRGHGVRGRQPQAAALPRAGERRGARVRVDCRTGRASWPKPGLRPPSIRRAATANRSSTRPDSVTCSRSGWTAWSPKRSGCRASPTQPS